jgi:hypothetical protein
MDHRALSCRQLTELASAYLEADGLDELTRDLAEEHLVFCDPCRHYIGQLRATEHALHHHHDDGPAPAVMQSLLSAFKGAR